ncbi:MAG: CC0125/CC1285 family lipoprotein [Candidatus Marisimplicoccus sp.]
MKRCLLLVILISGCSTMYQPTAYTGGYSNSQLDVDKFRVRFGCNGFVSSSYCQDMALLRSAEISIDNGYNYFIILNEDNSASNSSYTTPQQSYTTFYGSGNYVYANTNTYGGQTYNISKPSTTNTILLIRTRTNNSFNAQYILRDMCGRYGRYIKTNVCSKIK